MAKHQGGLRLYEEKLFSGAALQTLLSRTVPQGERWRLRSVAWEINKATSGGNTRCRLYIDVGAGGKVYLDEQLVPTADWLYTRAEDDVLHPGERLALEIDQGQASTLAKLYAIGEIEPEGGADA